MANSLLKSLFCSFIQYITAIFGPSLLVILLYLILEPRSLNDGQFILAFILSLPAGLILGAGLFISRVDIIKKYSAISPLIQSGVAVVILCLMMAFWSANTRNSTIAEFISTALSPWCLAPVISGIIFIIVGSITTKHSRGCCSKETVPDQVAGAVETAQRQQR